MRKKYPGIINVVLAAIVVLSLFVVTAAPASALTATGVVLGNNAAGRASTYTITFTSTATLTTADIITITFPTGTVVPAAILAANVTVNTPTQAAPPTATAVVTTPATRTVAITVPALIDGAADSTAEIGDVITVVITAVAGAGIINPTTPSGAAPSGLVTAHTLTVGLSTADAGPAISPAYTVAGITPAITPNLVGGSISGYTIPYRVGTIGASTYVAGTDTITITFPTGTVLPATISRGTVSVTNSLNGQTGNPPIDPVVDSVNRTLQVTIPAVQLNGTTLYANIAADATVNIVISQGAGIKNPTTATSVAGRVTTLSTSGAYSGVTAGTEANATSANFTYVRSVTRSPTSGSRGATVTLTGQGFQASSAITFTHPGPDAAFGTADDVGLGTATAASDGTFTGTVSANNPPFGAGANTIRATDGLGGFATAGFILNPSITIAPTSGRTGSTVWITPRDFPATATWTVAGTTIANTAVQVAAGTQLPNTQAALTAAGLTSFSVVLPNVISAGAQTIVLADTTNFTTSTATFTVEGRNVTLTPNSGPIGTQVTVQGSGFSAGAVGGAAELPAAGAGQGITIGANFWNTGVGTVPGGQDTDASGGFVVALPLGGTGLLAIEALATGVPHTVVAIDTNGLQGTSSFTITPRAITIAPTTSGRGSTVTVSGSGFRVNGQVNITYAGTNVGTATVSGGGTFSAAVTVPNGVGIPSSNTVAATDTNNAAVNALATHTVGSAAITVSPTSSASGGTVTVTGTGFPAYSTVAGLTVGGVGALPSPAPSTSATGAFSTTIMVPAVNTGSQPVVVTAGGISATATITVVAAVPTPTPTPVPSTTVAVMASIAPQLTVVWGFNAATQTWQVYDPNAPGASNTLPTIVEGSGYWIQMNAAATLTFGGKTRNLVQGWNLIGW